MKLREQYECIFSDAVRAELVTGEEGTVWFSQGPDRRLSFKSLLGSIQSKEERSIDAFTAHSLGPLVNPLPSELLAAAKLIFSDMGDDYWAIRGKINPYECLGKGPRRLFINRSATKLANLDSLFSFVDPYEPTFTFLDLCGGPGGFTEYFSLRCLSMGIHALGFGMTLSHPSHDHSCNWNLGHLDMPPRCALMNVGDSAGPDISLFILSGGGTGDILVRENVDSIRGDVAAVLGRKDYGSGVPLVAVVTADGGTDFDKSNTEEVAAHLILCQVIAMIQNIRPGGVFVLKYFSCHKICSFEIFYFLSHLFEYTAFTKPVTSRPATGEVYLVAKGFRNDMSGEERQQLVDTLWQRTIRTSNPLTATRNCLFSFSDNVAMRRAFLYCKEVNNSLIWHQLQACYAVQVQYLETFRCPSSANESQLIIKILSLLEQLEKYFSCSAQHANNEVSCVDTADTVACPHWKKQRVECYENIGGERGTSTLPSNTECSRYPSPTTVSSRDYYSYWGLYELQDQF